MFWDVWELTVSYIGLDAIIHLSNVPNMSQSINQSIYYLKCSLKWSQNTLSRYHFGVSDSWRIQHGEQFLYLMCSCLRLLWLKSLLNVVFILVYSDMCCGLFIGNHLSTKWWHGILGHGKSSKKTLPSSGTKKNRAFVFVYWKKCCKTAINVCYVCVMQNTWRARYQVQIWVFRMQI